MVRLSRGVSLSLADAWFVKVLSTIPATNYRAEWAG
jgi:hypothetical protein